MNELSHKIPALALLVNTRPLLAWIIHESRLRQRRGRGQRSCSDLPRVGYNEGFVVRSARPKGKECRHKNGNVYVVSRTYQGR